MQVNSEDHPQDIYVTWSNPRMTDFENAHPGSSSPVHATPLCFRSIRWEYPWRVILVDQLAAIHVQLGLLTCILAFPAQYMYLFSSFQMYQMRSVLTCNASGPPRCHTAGAAYLGSSNPVPFLSIYDHIWITEKLCHSKVRILHM